MIDYKNSPIGYWQVANKYFIKKLDAIIESTATNTKIDYHFFDRVWESFDRSTIGNHNLQQLYKIRAQQLRDKYDYLILYFSGGADSYNVLRSFIDNGIHLDEVCVKWCNNIFDANTKIYTPNNLDMNSTNYLSEWDYAIAPVLNHLRQYYPHIHIQIEDWMPDVNKKLTYDDFLSMNHWYDYEVPWYNVFSRNEERLVSEGKKVAAIYGVDKPNTVFDDDHGYMFFTDQAITMANINPLNPNGIELFYWTPDLPALAYEMAMVSLRWQVSDYDHYAHSYTYNKIAEGKKNLSKEELDQMSIDIGQYQTDHLRHLIYDNWTNVYQCNKPTLLDRRDKHPWIYNINQLQDYRNSFYGIIDDLTSNLNDWYIITDFNNSKRCKRIPTKKILVLENYKKLSRIWSTI